MPEWYALFSGNMKGLQLVCEDGDYSPWKHKRKLNLSKIVFGIYNEFY
jgi:hypothetical protein